MANKDDPPIFADSVYTAPMVQFSCSVDIAIADFGIQTMDFPL